MIKCGAQNSLFSINGGVGLEQFNFLRYLRVNKYYYRRYGVVILMAAGVWALVVASTSSCRSSHYLIVGRSNIRKAQYETIYFQIRDIPSIDNYQGFGA